jgi:cysteine desulfurase family protein
MTSSNKRQITYLNNAATSFPKPAAVVRAVRQAMLLASSSPGRAGYGESLAEREIFETRQALAILLGVADPSRLIFTKNATEALNLALRGALHPGDHVVTTSMEHNSVARPLSYLRRRGVSFTRVMCAPDGTLDPAEIERAVQPNTRLIAAVHASNVCGTILPVRDLARIARDRGLLLLVDAAQTAGVIPVNLDQLGADFVAFSGHKGLLGPQGTGALYVRDPAPLEPLIFGGTGSRSDSPSQPDFPPDKFESGTPNVPGLAGLGAGARFVYRKGVANILKREIGMTRILLEGLAELPQAAVYGPRDVSLRVGVVSLNIGDLDPGQAALRLENEFGIVTRSGLHCAPWAHETIGTLQRGTLRFSLGWATTRADVARALRALHEIARTA